MAPPMASRETEPDMTPRSVLTHIGNWTLGKTLGRGAYAHVRLATHVSGRKAACKILPALHQDPRLPVTWDQTIDAVEAHKEVVLLKALSGLKLSGVVELEGVIERDGWTYMFSTLHPTSAAEVPMPWEHDKLINFFRRLCLTVHSLHQLDISHEDLKRSNVLVDRLGLPALIDFGFSHFSPHGGYVRSAGGTLDYSSPEKTKDVKYDGPTNDVWSLGIILVKLLRIPHPFIDLDHDTASQAKAKIIKAEGFYDFQRHHLGRGQAASLIVQMLEPNPQLRITLPEILDHPFLFPTRMDPHVFVPPPLTLPTKLKHALPQTVIQDVAFLAYLNKEIFLCETTVKIEERIYGETQCWEKRWARMLNRWKEREEMDWEDLPVAIKPVGTVAVKPQVQTQKRPILKEINLDATRNTGLLPATVGPAARLDKTKHVHEVAGLPTQGHGRVLGSPKRLRPIPEKVLHSPKNRAAAPSRIRLGLSGVGRPALVVKKASKRTDRGKEPNGHRAVVPTQASNLLSSSSTNVHHPVMKPIPADLLQSWSSREYVVQSYDRNDLIRATDDEVLTDSAELPRAVSRQEAHTAVKSMQGPLSNDSPTPVRRSTRLAAKGGLARGLR